LKHLGRCFLGLLAAGLVGAEPAPESLELDELLGQLASTHGVRAEFRELKQLQLLDEPLEIRGALYFIPPDRLVRTTSAPAVTRLLLDGVRMSFEDEAGSQAVDLSDDPVARQFAGNLVALFRGDRAVLERSYRLSFRSAGQRWELSLVPKSAPLDRFIEQIRLAGIGRSLSEMELVEKDGDRTQTVFEKVEPDHRFGADEEQTVFGPGSAP